VVELPFGFAVLNSIYPHSWEHNRVVVGEAAPDPALVIRTTDEVLARAGCAHRRCDFDRPGSEVVAGLVALQTGWEPEETRLMVFTPNDLPEYWAPVQAVTLDQLAPALAAHWQASYPQFDAAVVAELVARPQVTATASDVTHLAVVESGRPVSWCTLRQVGAVAEIDEVGTALAYRNRGYGRAVVLDAVARARAAGADLVWLAALAQDWPRDWYGRLGFQEVGTRWVLQRGG
jgi:ribosomal protein S18 acetylase RimI-like enzyme